MQKNDLLELLDEYRTMVGEDVYLTEIEGKQVLNINAIPIIASTGPMNTITYNCVLQLSSPEAEKLLSEFCAHFEVLMLKDGGDITLSAKGSFGGRAAALSTFTDLIRAVQMIDYFWHDTQEGGAS